MSTGRFVFGKRTAGQSKWEWRLGDLDDCPRMSIQTDITQNDFRAFARYVTAGKNGGRSTYILLY